LSQLTQIPQVRKAQQMRKESALFDYVGNLDGAG
jgi:hypothetical protein|tara:strand:+ start:904 stop:1005 length:102 start_codon:yes stop_codon:yes gene_type:complete